ncbi:SGNH/GDSL hydrolase family protein [Actinoplanes teichomyceticus]|uniref:GDSL-like lipase/acylhydrolase family protein n=1 Tax=Actinoplanes teichomyceticus TaxID=1867 RepID=A0A561VCV1_ACTTI|nr:SGNH/GDSL hydrolase family protein [Actinoplanes teichomyceticus]TWG09427.1 GDSL-like lipase/acylhydrolase family protein [Actinoplanes teichomyceticus]GIF17098.1 lipase [Actinoplanes teichomyceticus]
MPSLRLPAVLAAAVLLTVTPLPAAATPGGHRALTVHTAGRVQPAAGTLRYSWPGVYFEGRFRGAGVGIALDDAAADYDVQIDGTTVATLVTPGRTTYQVRGLTPGVHTVRVVKRSESPWAVSGFGGFVAAPGGAVLPAAPPRRRQIEFIGDSYTAGYGNLSTSRDCTGDQVNRTTDADLSFGALTARRLGADYQINAFSGRGMVRNYNGIDPGVDYRTYYDRALLGVDGDRWHDPRWRPQVVVVGLGINDFSTPINPGEPWTAESLAAAYRAAYHGFLDKLRARYGPRTDIVVSATAVSGTTQLADLAQRVVGERADRVHYWYYDSAGLDYAGCHWHPSAHDHEVIAARLRTYLDTLALSW